MSSWTGPGRASARRRSILLVALFFFGSLVLPGASAAESWSQPEYPVKAAFLYKFALYVEWPESAFETETSPLVVGVRGPDQLIAQVEDAVRDRDLDGRPFVVRRITGREFDAVHLLFVAGSEQSRVSRLLPLPERRATLVVTESPAGLDAGAVINFVIRDDRVRFDVDLESAEKYGLKLSAQLLKIARRVRGATS